VVATLLATTSSIAAADATRVTAGARSTGAVALTFDDGWNQKACSSIARTLREYGATGTFFINGRVMRTDPAAWRRILRGHEVGNHTWSHPDLTHLGSASVLSEISKTEAIHERVLGRPMLKVLRPPYGAQDARIRHLAGRLGYQRTVLWSADTLDWTSTATVGSIIARATGAPPGSIILMHCGPSETPLAVASIIRHYKARGIRLAGLDVVLGLRPPPPPRPPVKPGPHRDLDGPRAPSPVAPGPW
jgi:peptidoglycan/xylan/chitin deacetylase (PgdA/CDA1 family)